MSKRSKGLLNTTKSRQNNASLLAIFYQYRPTLNSDPLKMFACPCIKSSPCMNASWQLYQLKALHKTKFFSHLVGLCGTSYSPPGKYQCPRFNTSQGKKMGNSIFTLSSPVSNKPTVHSLPPAIQLVFFGCLIFLSWKPILHESVFMGLIQTNTHCPEKEDWQA